jgi:hypothetical protein
MARLYGLGRAVSGHCGLFGPDGYGHTLPVWRVEPQIPFDFAQGRLFDYGCAFAQADTFIEGMILLLLS